MQRKNYDLRSCKAPPTGHSVNARRKSKILVRPGSPKHRSFNTILNSGAYTREKFVPEHPTVDREAAKKHFQDLMAFGKQDKPKLSQDERKKIKEAGRKTEDKAGNRFDQSKFQKQDDKKQ